MTNGLRPYPEYKNTGVPWLGAIPAHWAAMRCKYLFREVDTRSENGEETHLSMSQKHGLIPSKDMDGRRLHSESYAGGKLCQPHDLVLNRLKAHLGVFAHARQSGVVSPDYTVLRPAFPEHVAYFEHVFKTPACVSELRCSTKGIVEGFWRLYTDDFYRIRVPLPPASERDAILAFLRSVDATVRRFIRNRRRLIEVLNEQMQAIINQAVTRGLDPSVPLKPSGHDLLGDVPAHWEVRPLRSLGRFMKGTGGSKEDDVDKGLPCIRYGHLYMYFDYVVPSAKTFIDESRAQDYGRTQYGDILFTASGEDIAEIGKSAANLIEGDVWCGGDVIILRPRLTVDARFLGYASDAWHAAAQKSRLGRGTTIKHIYEDQLKNVWMAIPPIDEQAAIAAHIDKSVAEIERATSRAHDEIRLIHEYRTRLITDVVTGKLDVRGFVPTEPMPADEPADEPIEEVGLEDEEAELVKEAVDAAD